MSLLRSIKIAQAAAVIFVSAASAQFLHIGDADLQLPDMTSGGKPTTLTISGLSDITNYAFDGSTLDVPFTLNGTGATVWLLVYTVDQTPPLTIPGDGPAPYADPEHAGAGWHVYDGVDMLVAKTAGERFEEGDNVISWDGLDTDGNAVAAGQYDLFLAAFDDDAVPHIVGVAGRQFGGGRTIYINTARGEFVNFATMEHCNMEQDWITSGIDGWDTVDNQSLVDACGEREGCSATANAATSLNADMTEWIGNDRSNTGWWVKRYSYDWDPRQMPANADWGADYGAEGGILSAGDILPAPGRQYHSATNADKSIIYGTVGVSGIVSKIAGFSVETGAYLPAVEWDLSDMFLYDNNGADRSGGPGTLARFYNGEPDPYGLTMSGHHTSLTARLDYDGNVKYMNRNGDGFGDSKAFADGTFGDFAYGHTAAPAFKYIIYSTKRGWVSNVEAGTNSTQNGFMLGEDGSGLFHFSPKRIPLTWPQYNIIVDEDGDWDGMYMTIGGFGEEAAANDFLPHPEEGLDILSHYPLVQLPYDQKRVTLGSAATAVSAIEGELPESYSLGNAYPNPFNPETAILFSLPWEVDVQVTVYNQQGQMVRSLVNDTMGPGKFQVTWDGRDDNGVEVATGVYLYRIEAPNLSLHKKVTFLK